MQASSKSVAFHFSLVFFLLVLVLVSSRQAVVAATKADNPMPELELELLYFDVPGRAEPIRILLHAAGIPFEDKRFPGKVWSALKPTTPLGQVPIMTIKYSNKNDGESSSVHCQSAALTRFAAKKAGCYPRNDDIQAMMVDEVVDSVNELMGKAPRSEDPDDFVKLRQDFQATTMVQYASYLEAKIQTNHVATAPYYYIVGTSLTMADLVLHGMIEAVQSGAWDHVDSHFFDAYPGIIALAKAVEDDEKVKAYHAFKGKATSSDEL